jgi:hypothetical protein
MIDRGKPPFLRPCLHRAGDGGDFGWFSAVMRLPVDDVRSMMAAARRETGGGPE